MSTNVFVDSTNSIQPNGNRRRRLQSAEPFVTIDYHSPNYHNTFYRRFDFDINKEHQHRKPPPLIMKRWSSIAVIPSSTNKLKIDHNRFKHSNNNHHCLNRRYSFDIDKPIRAIAIDKYRQSIDDDCVVVSNNDNNRNEC